MSEPRRPTEIKRNRDTPRVGDTVEIEGRVYRVVGVDASTPGTDAAMALDAARGGMIISYQLEYVRPAPAPGSAGGSAPRPAPRSKAKAGE